MKLTVSTQGTLRLVLGLLSRGSLGRRGDLVFALFWHHHGCLFLFGVDFPKNNGVSNLAKKKGEKRTTKTNKWVQK